MAVWAYLADLGGNVYRISGENANTEILSTAPADWTITKIASLGCSSPSDNCSANRKFMFRPSVVEKGQTFYLMLGSGDREKPLDDTYWPNSYAVQNYFFMIKDKPEDADWLEDAADTCVEEVICKDSLLEIDPDSDEPPDPVDLEDAKGWMLPLDQDDPSEADPDDDLHEQVVTAAITVFGTTTFSTHSPATPAVGACTSNLGRARVYNIKFMNAEPRKGPDGQPLPRWQDISGDGLPPSPVAGRVTMDSMPLFNADGTPMLNEDGTQKMDPGKTVPFIIGAEGSSSLEGSAPTQDPAKAQPKSLTYWYIEK
jgi:type IV pilus assembly protein PilY1